MFRLAPLPAELIEPSRTLKSATGGPGQLTVFSEPPDLLVKLDGTPVGQTPVRLQEVNPGNHQLQVKQSVTEITIESGKTFHISLFRGKFIRFEVAEEESLGASEGNALPESEIPAQQTSPEHSRIKKENRKAWERWMQFVNGSQNHF